ncbi:hypothetical protein SEPCBS119000_004157 [Sporothrix epigloea]|uniref:Uncharacterized protein n=1 Tax=Sporothrix epigloea TaxID=1892477 RepID=A0ABP0DUC3_9PEZI
MDSIPSINLSQPRAAPPAARLSSASPPTLSLIPSPEPQRNARRSSFLLGALFNSTTAKSTVTTIPAVAGEAGSPTPHDLYLSSEEDASSMGDLSDLSDYEADLDDDLYSMDNSNVHGAFTVELARTASIVMRTGSTSSLISTTTVSTSAASPTTSLPHERDTSSRLTHSRRPSHDTARVVSVIFAGKPSLVDLGLGRDICRQPLNCCKFTSSAGVSETRPDAPTTAVSSSRRHKRSMSSSSAMASYLARTAAVTASPETKIQSTVPALAVPDVSLSLPPPPNTPSPHSEPAALAGLAPPSYTYTAPAPTSLLFATDDIPAPPIRSCTTSLLIPPSSSASAASSPRTSTFGSSTGSLLRGVTRSLTLSGRRGLGRRASSALEKSGSSAAPSASCTASVPAEDALALETQNRMSLAMPNVPVMTLMTPPPSRPLKNEGRSEHDTAQASALPGQRAMAPAAVVVSKKSSGSLFLGNLTGRRWSTKLL